VTEHASDRAALLPGCESPLALWDGEPLDRLRELWGIPRLLVCERVGSTNDVATALAEEGAPSGTCVIAEEQTAGRGRRATRWDSPPGLGIWLSLLLRPGPAADPRLLPLLAGLAVARAVEPFCRPAKPRVKWPNDVLVGGGKLSGILCAANWKDNKLDFVIVGIGLNVRQVEDDFPAELRESATSLRLVAGLVWPRPDVAGAVVRSVVAMPHPSQFDAATLQELARYDALRGREVAVEEPGTEPLQGEAAGIDADGSLLVRDADGTVHNRHSGTVRLVEGGSSRSGAHPPATHPHG
jgi:BirA family transcriptional regulator, biotin operon repressor / biotin---[acetyl-CoA-carboxylase] ligase